MQSASYIWAKILGALEQTFGAVAVSAWFDDAELVTLDDRSLVICSPSDFRQETIRRVCKNRIEQLLKEEFGLALTFEVWSEEQLRNHRQDATQDTPWVCNPHFSFSTFVAGQINLIPYKAALHVAEKLGDSVYNPLYLYGPPGVGKTHLLYAIANKASQLHPNARIVYTKGDQFTNELIQAILHSNTVAFKKKYREADLLLIDDIQFIAGKEATQEEFFHTFNTLYELGKQIIMTSDRIPRDMPTLEDRLKSRFGEGVTVQISPPDLETRKLIIRAKARQLELPLDDSITDYLAQVLYSNVRQIEGSLRKIRAFRDLSGMTLSRENVAKTIADIQTLESSAAVTPDLIIRYVCRYYGVEEPQLKGLQRSRNISEPRQAAIYLIRKMTCLSLTDIGKLFCRDHGTVLHAIEKIRNALQSPQSGMAEKLQEIERSIEANT